jgi:hypothetical protein
MVKICHFVLNHAIWAVDEVGEPKNLHLTGDKAFQSKFILFQHLFFKVIIFVMQKVIRSVVNKLKTNN